MKRFWLLLFLTLCLVTSADSDNLKYGIPQETDFILDRTGFALGYSVSHRQALWVSYILTAEEVESQEAKRQSHFKTDIEVPGDPVSPKEYIHSGLDRGHLAPAADMAFSKEAMKNSFLMSNISPQYPGFNRGIWSRLESFIRKLALRYHTVVVITDPVFTNSPPVLKNNLIIPDAFFKVIYIPTSIPEQMIGFLIPNKSSNKEIFFFVKTVDEIEDITNMDFFSKLPECKQLLLESKVNLTTFLLEKE